MEAFGGVCRGIEKERERGSVGAILKGG